MAFVRMPLASGTFSGKRPDHRDSFLRKPLVSGTPYVRFR